MLRPTRSSTGRTLPKPSRTSRFTFKPLAFIRCPSPLHLVPLPPVYHQGSRLHGSSGTAPDGSTLCNRLHPHSDSGSLITKVLSARSVHPELHVIGNRWIHHTPYCSQTWSLIRRNNLRCCWHISVCGVGVGMACEQCQRPKKRAVAGALQISIGNLGAVLGTQLYRTETAPRYYLGHFLALGCLVASLLVVSTLWVVLKTENDRRDRVEGRGEGRCLARR